MLTEERRQMILDMLQKEERVIAKELAEKFQLSIDSIRRDLTIMEEQGLLKKAYGGAITLTKVRKLPAPESLRYGEGLAYQNAISKLAASFIQENDSVFIGGAGIQYGMLKYLSRDFPFTVVTNSLKIAQTIREWENIDSYMIGGKLSVSSGNIIDSLAIELIGKFSFDLCFITGGGISVKGISTATPGGASFARAVSEVSRRIICLAPHEKIGIDMFASSLPLHQLDVIITDEETPEETVSQFRSQGVQVDIASDKI